MDKFRIAATLVFATALIAGAHAEEQTPFKEFGFYGDSLTVADTPDKAGVFHFDGKTLFFNRTGKRKETVWIGNAAAEPSKNKVAPAAWADVTIDGMAYKIPLYQ